MPRFHASCVKLDSARLPDTWYCPGCAGYGEHAKALTPLGRLPSDLPAPTHGAVPARPGWMWSPAPVPPQLHAQLQAHMQMQQSQMHMHAQMQVRMAMWAAAVHGQMSMPPSAMGMAPPARPTSTPPATARRAAAEAGTRTASRTNGSRSGATLSIAAAPGQAPVETDPISHGGQVRAASEESCSDADTDLLSDTSEEGRHREGWRVPMNTAALSVLVNGSG